MPFEKPHTSPGHTLRIFVRRGATRRFAKLTRDASNLPVAVEWDRRAAGSASDTSDGRSARRVTRERRQEPPYTWTVADFVVAEDRRLENLVTPPPSATGFYVSSLGTVVCADHAAMLSLAHWLGGGWQPAAMSSGSRHNCQICAAIAASGTAPCGALI
jgi:hypothetical protein